MLRSTLHNLELVEEEAIVEVQALLHKLERARKSIRNEKVRRVIEAEVGNVILGHGKEVRRVEEVKKGLNVTILAEVGVVVDRQAGKIKQVGFN